MELTHEEQAMLGGEHGPAAELAMDIVVSVARAEAADQLVAIEGSHIDGCLYHGPSGLDFARLLVEGGARVRVPTTLNVASVDMLHPDLYRGDPAEAARGKELADAYVAMGCLPTWTCAPYQLPDRPGRGVHVAWGESNAIVFANSVLGARTSRYGDFMDICCAITGRAPRTGLHTDEGRAATLVLELAVPDAALDSDALYPLLGYAVGEMSGAEVPLIVGLDGRADEDRLKALGAAAASSGAVGMFHALGVTPEAPDVETATRGADSVNRTRITEEYLFGVRDRLTTSVAGLGAVSVGTPHMSLEGMRLLAALVDGARSRVPFYVNTSRAVASMATEEGLSQTLERFGVTVVTDTCTYITPIMGEVTGAVMTDSAKWAHYAPANLGVDVIFGSLSECAHSASEGRVVTTPGWR